MLENQTTFLSNTNMKRSKLNLMSWLVELHRGLVSCNRSVGLLDFEDEGTSMPLSRSNAQMNLLSKGKFITTNINTCSVQQLSRPERKHTSSWKPIRRTRSRIPIYSPNRQRTLCNCWIRSYRLSRWGLEFWQLNAIDCIHPLEIVLALFHLKSFSSRRSTNVNEP